MPKRKRKGKKPTKTTITGEPLITLYRRIYLGEWADIKPAALKKADPRFIPLDKNLSRTIIRAKEKVEQFKAGEAGELVGPVCLNLNRLSPSFLLCLTVFTYLDLKAVNWFRP